MYRNKYQRGFLTIFFSVGSKPLELWETHIKDGCIKRFLDQDIKSMVVEIRGTNVSTTYISCPKGNQVLGITMPFLVMIVKNLKKYFTFEITILDDTRTRRRFRVSNFQSATQILPLCTAMPIGLAEDWNQIQFNLAEFTRRAYNKQFVEVQRMKINANIRLRRVYFADRLIHTDDLPDEYKLFFPIDKKEMKEDKAMKKPSQVYIPNVNVSNASIKVPGTETLIDKSNSPISSIHSTKVIAVRPSKENVEESIHENPDQTTDDFIATILEEINENVFKNL